MILAVTTAAGCADGDGRTGAAPVVARQSALVQSFRLPIPVGANPESLVVGAADYVALNDCSALIETDGQVGNAGTVGALVDNIGVATRLRHLWASGPVLVRGSTIAGYVKAGGQLTIQQGSTFGEPQENRQLVPIRADPWFTVSITTSDDTSFNSVEPTKSTTLNPGTTGNWAVKTGGTLTLSSPESTASARSNSSRAPASSCRRRGSCKSTSPTA